MQRTLVLAWLKETLGMPPEHIPERLAAVQNLIVPDLLEGDNAGAVAVLRMLRIMQTDDRLQFSTLAVGSTNLANKQTQELLDQMIKIWIAHVDDMDASAKSC